MSVSVLQSAIKQTKRPGLPAWAFLAGFFALTGNKDTWACLWLSH